MTRLVSADEARRVVATREGIVSDVDLTYRCAATVIALSKERDDARAIVNACMGAVPVTTVAFTGDVPLYVRACFDAVAAERRENVAGLERAVDVAAERIGELVAERDRLRAILYREGYAPCSSAACNCGGWHK